MTESGPTEIVDAAGEPISRPARVRDHLKKGSQVARRTIMWTIGAIALIAGLLANGGKILDAVRPDPKAIKVPDVAVKLRNTGNVEVSLPTRGEYWLWPPGGGVQHYAGAYEFRQLDNSDIEAPVITLSSQSTRELLVHLSNPALASYLATGDYHIDFMFRTDQDGRNIVWSGPIAFTEKALSHAYLIDVFEEAGDEL